MAEHVVYVEFDIAEGQLEAFLPLVVANAASSLELEPGCRRFDVLLPQDGGSRVHLYEIYDDVADFRKHLTMPHFLEFDAASRDMIAGRRIVPLSPAAPLG